MPTLALDTSDTVTVALTGDDGTVLASRSVSEQRRHAEQLAPMIQQVLASTGLQPTGIDRIVVGTGPAPFTGLRVGLVTARTLGLATGADVDGVCTLDALAALASERLALPAGTDLLVATDAKRREVYYALYRTGEGGPERVLGPAVDRAENVVAAGHATGAVVVGPGAQLYADTFAPAAKDLPQVDFDDLGPALVSVAARERAAGAQLPTEPLYLRRPDAQEPAARKRATR